MMVESMIEKVATGINFLIASGLVRYIFVLRRDYCTKEDVKEMICERMAISEKMFEKDIKGISDKLDILLDHIQITVGR